MVNNTLTENSLYKDSAGRDALLADKEKLADILLYNFFGFVALYSITSNGQQIKKYQSEEKKLQLGSIGDDNLDVSLAVKLAVDGGLMTSAQSAAFTKLLYLMKTHAVKGHEILDDKIRDLVKLAKLDTSHKPSTPLRGVVSDFMDGTINLPFIAYGLFKFVKKFPDITGEFYEMYMKGHYHKQFSNFMSGHGKLARGVPQHLIKKTSNMTVVYSPNANLTGNTATTTQVTAQPTATSTVGVSANPTPSNNIAGVVVPQPTTSVNTNKTTVPKAAKTPKAPNNNAPALNAPTPTPKVEYFHNSHIDEKWVQNYVKLSQSKIEIEPTVIDVNAINNMSDEQFNKAAIELISHIQMFNSDDIEYSVSRVASMFTMLDVIFSNRLSKNGIIELHLIQYINKKGKIVDIAGIYSDTLLTSNTNLDLLKSHKSDVESFLRKLFSVDGYVNNVSNTNGSVSLFKMLNDATEIFYGLKFIDATTSLSDLIEEYILKDNPIRRDFGYKGVLRCISYFNPLANKMMIVLKTFSLKNSSSDIVNNNDGTYSITYDVSTMSTSEKNTFDGFVQQIKEFDNKFYGIVETAKPDSGDIDVINKTYPKFINTDKSLRYDIIFDDVAENWQKLVDANVTPTHAQVKYCYDTYIKPVWGDRIMMQSTIGNWSSFFRNVVEVLVAKMQEDYYEFLITLFGIIVTDTPFNKVNVKDNGTLKFLVCYFGYMSLHAPSQESKDDFRKAYDDYMLNSIENYNNDNPNSSITDNMIRIDNVLVGYFDETVNKFTGDYNAKAMLSKLQILSNKLKSGDMLGYIIDLINTYDNNVDKFGSALFSAAYKSIKKNIIEELRNSATDKKNFDLTLASVCLPLAQSNQYVIDAIKNGDEDYMYAVGSSIDEYIRANSSRKYQQSKDDFLNKFNIEISDDFMKAYETYFIRNSASAATYGDGADEKIKYLLNRNDISSEEIANLKMLKFCSTTFVDKLLLNANVGDKYKDCGIDIYTSRYYFSEPSNFVAAIKMLYVVDEPRQIALSKIIKLGSKESLERFVENTSTETLQSLFPENEDMYKKLTKEAANKLIEICLAMMTLTSRKKLVRMRVVEASEYLEERLAVLLNLGYTVTSSTDGVDLSKLKKSLTASKVRTAIVDVVKSSVITPDFKRYKTVDIQKALTWNGVNIMQNVKVERVKKTDTIADIIKSANDSVNKSVSVILPELPVKEVKRTVQEHVQNSSDLVKKYANGRHGDIVPLIKREFDVEFPGNKEAFDAFVAENPTTEILEPAFHSCGTLAASFILRYGFAEIKDASIVTGKMLGEGLYVTNVIDKSILYASDSGYSKSTGERGYTLQFKAALGKRGEHYNYAGPYGKYSGGIPPAAIVRSEEWALKKARSQALFVKAFEINTVTNSKLNEIKKANNVK